MKSINTKFITFTLVVIILCTFFVGGITVKYMSALSNNDSTDILNLLVRESASDMNGILGRTEQSVEILADCVDDYISYNGSDIADSAFFDGLSSYIDPLLINAARATESCIGAYIRYSTELAPPDSGLFYTKSSEEEGLKSFPCTDISLYEKDDIEHVGWYYIPRDTGKPTWMLPYYNGNIDEYIISYIIPLYMEGTFIGIIGIDIDFTMIEEKVSAITVYKTGRAYLADDNFNIIYHPLLPSGTTPAEENIQFQEIYDKYAITDSNGNLYHYNYDGISKVYTYSELKNGLNLCIAVPEREINNNLAEMIKQILVFMLLAAAVSIVIIIIMCRTLTKPLHKLTAAAVEISKGRLDIEIGVNSADEIGMLADTLQKTTKSLKQYIEKTNRLAYLDSMTGVENKTAYNAAVKLIEEKIKGGTAEFAVAVLDLNGLKKTNDTLGHYYGDMLIMNAAKLIEGVFVDCPVYRIGGDEFVVILEGVNYVNRAAFDSNLSEALAMERERGGEQCVSIAYGFAEFSKNDGSYSDVFSRADAAMYENKKKSKTAEH